MKTFLLNCKAILKLCSIFLRNPRKGYYITRMVILERKRQEYERRVHELEDEFYE